MGWGEFVSPAEAQAAADAKEMAEADALAEDRRTAMLCEAIRSGLYEIADAIRDAAAVPARQVLDTDNDDEVRPYRGPQDDVKFDAEAARKAFDMSFDPRPPEDDPDMRYLMRYLVGGDETPE